MIALADYLPNPTQKKVKDILERVTGLTVKVVPFQPPVAGMSSTVEYVFKAGYSKNEDIDSIAKGINANHDYIKHFIYDIGGLTHDNASVVRIGRVNDVNDDMYPWTSVRFSNVMGHPSSDEAALASVEQMERHVVEHATQENGTSLAKYRGKLRDENPFNDGYGKQLGG